MGRFETEWLTGEANLAALADLSGAWTDRVHACKPQKTIVLDMDSSMSETHGVQEDSAYNGHFGCTCYHPLFVFNQFGDLDVSAGLCVYRRETRAQIRGWGSRAILRHRRTATERLPGRKRKNPCEEAREGTTVGPVGAKSKPVWGIRAKILQWCPFQNGSVARKIGEYTGGKVPWIHRAHRTFLNSR
jgi:hypothetical protein